jgi:hypothetical protein
MNSNRRIVNLAIASLGLCAAGSAMSQANPYYVGIAQAFTHENNLFRVANGLPKTSDTYSTTSLLAGIDQPFGRQRFFGDVAARLNRYQDSSQLNNTGYGLAVGLDWETIENLSGRVSYSLNQNLARFGADEGPALTTKNMERSQEFLARAQYGRVSLLSIEGIFTHRQLDFSAPQFAFQEYKQDAISLGVLYRPSGLLTLGAAARHTKGEYPFALETAPGVFQADDFSRNDIDLTAVWVPTGLSTVRARLSYTKVSHDAVGSRDISAGTGAVSWEYKPTGKLAFTTELIHDTGAEASFNRLNPGSVSSIGNNSRISTSLSVRGLWEATAKIQVEANARYIERDLVNTFALPSGGASTEAGSDKFAEAKLGVNYAPIRSVLLGCAVGYEKRGASSAVSYPYSANIVTCSGQFKLQ